MKNKSVITTSPSLYEVHMSDEMAAQSYNVSPITMISCSKQLKDGHVKNHLNLSNKRLAVPLP